MLTKFNLIINDSTKLLQTHQNITVFPVENKYNCNVQEGEILNLDWILSDGEADEIIADSILEYFPYEQLTNILSNWIKKLSLTGSIIIVGCDLKELSRLYTFGKLNDEQYYNLTYGKQKESWEIKKSGSHLNEMCSVLSKFGLQVVRKEYNTYKYVIEAKRGN